MEMANSRYSPTDFAWSIFRSLKWLLAFVACFCVLTIANVVVWEVFVDGTLYNCTDPLFGYLSPDGWAHAWEGHPIAMVKDVIRDDDMSHSDTIKEGWSIGGLWCVWGFLFVSSLVVSAIFARLVFRLK